MVRLRTNGAHPLFQWRDEVDRLMTDLWGGVSNAVPRAFASTRAFPALNVWEQGNDLFAEAELPGVTAENVDVSVVGDELTLRGRRSESTANEAAYHRRERGVGEFTRVLRLPYEVDADQVQATLADGVLTIRLPKAPSARPRKIQVSAGS